MVHVDTDVNGYAGDAEALSRLVLSNQILAGSGGKQRGTSASIDSLAAKLAAGHRFLILNAWRSADASGRPVGRAPLALLSSRYVEAAGRFPQHRPDARSSRWYAFPSMADKEVLLFTQYDRKLSRHSELWHCALPDVVESEDAPPRRSLEVRVLVVLDQVLAPHEDRWKALDAIRPMLTFEESCEFCEEQARARHKVSS